MGLSAAKPQAAFVVEVTEIAHAAGIDPREADGMVEKTIATA
jgi:hypothetical protein